MDALVGAVVGGILTALGTFVVSLALDRRSRSHWQRETQLAAAKEVLGALQDVIRRMIDVARAESRESYADWELYHQGAIRWNAARYAAALVCPTSEIARLDALDREVDRLLDLAIQREWPGREFRDQRQDLGRLAADYIREVRANAGQSPADIPSLWTWDNGPRHVTSDSREASQRRVAH